MRQKIQTKDLITEDWLRLRKTMIGGSDAGAVLGLSKWRSPMQVYADKTSDKIENIENDAMHFGTILEDIVIQEFARRTGKKVRKNNYIHFSKEYDFIGANLDGEIVGEDAILEAKTASAYVADEWGNLNDPYDGVVPISYMCQVQHYMYVMGVKKAYFAVLIGGNTFTWKEIPRDDEFINDLLVPKLVSFWNENVLAKVMPEVDGSEACTEYLGSMFSESTDSYVELSEADNETLIYRAELQEKLKQIKKDIDKCSNEIKLKMAENNSASSGDYDVTWKETKTKRFDVKLFQIDHSDMYQKYLKEGKSRKFLVKRRKD